MTVNVFCCGNNAIVCFNATKKGTYALTCCFLKIQMKIIGAFKTPSKQGNQKSISPNQLTQKSKAPLKCKQHGK